MGKRLAIVGPESSGKTTLCNQLAQHLGGQVVPEMARTYLELNGPDYVFEDISQISELQFEAWENALKKCALQNLICDTDWMNLLLWSRIKYGKVDPSILRKVRSIPFDVVFLCAPDIPWEPDPLREHPNKRDWLWVVWVEALQSFGIPFIPLHGPHKFMQAIGYI
jgi:nicotinamide riboside kinase